MAISRLELLEVMRRERAHEVNLDQSPKLTADLEVGDGARRALEQGLPLVGPERAPDLKPGDAWANAKGRLRLLETSAIVGDALLIEVRASAFEVHLTGALAFEQLFERAVSVCSRRR